MGWLRPNVGDNGSEQACPTPRPVWRGGLLADEMGLGKTLSMLALIATDSRQRNDPLVTSDIHVTKQVFSTLIIVPLSCESTCLAFRFWPHADNMISAIGMGNPSSEVSY
jgi:hypothetical protein